MKKFWFPLIALVVSCASILYVVHARAETEIPESRGWVTDLTGSMPSNSFGVLAIKEKAFSLSGDTATRTVVLTLMVPTTGGESIDDYALRVAEKWHPGRKGEERGVLLVIAKSDKKWAIKTTRNVGQTLTDYDSKKLLTKMGAYLKKHKGDFIGAVDLFYTELPQYVQLPPEDRPAESTPESVAAAPEPLADERGVPGWVWFIFSLIGAGTLIAIIHSWIKKKESEEEIERACKEAARREAAFKASLQQPSHSSSSANPKISTAAAAILGAGIAARATPSVKITDDQTAIRASREAARRRRESEEEDRRRREKEDEESRVREESRRKRQANWEQQRANDEALDASAALAGIFAASYISRDRDPEPAPEPERSTYSAPAREPDPVPDYSSTPESYDGGGASSSFDSD